MDRPHASAEELLAFALDGEPLSPTVQQHLNCCPVCQQQVSCYQKTTAYLIPRLYRHQCPSAAILSSYCLPGALTDTDQRQLTEHLAHCPLCASELAETRQFLENHSL